MKSWSPKEQRMWLIGGGIAVAIIILAVLFNADFLKTKVYSPTVSVQSTPMPSTSVPTPSSIAQPAKKICVCQCYLGSDPDSPYADRLCSVKHVRGVCSDPYYDHKEITTAAACEAKNGELCRGYKSDNQKVLGAYGYCSLINVPQ